MGKACARGSGADTVASKTGTGYLCLSPMTTSTDQCSSNVFINGKGVVRKDDKVAGHPSGGCGNDGNGLTSFSGSVFVNGKNIGRKGDQYSSDNTITSGSSNVFAG